jgi:hypothetical protein
LKTKAILEEYAKHSVLNLGQAMHGLRYIYSHPDCDEAAAPGTGKHLALSLSLRAKRIANDFFFAVIPPHWHHTDEDLRVMRTVPLRKWFFYGYSAWRFSESGEVRGDLDGNVDRRWDPRCKRPQT